MKKLLLSTFVISAITLVLVSCEKGGDDDGGGGPAPKTKTELLSQSSWKYDTAAIDQNNDGTTDMQIPAGMIEDCQRDNIMTFTATGNGTIDEGGSKCNAGDPQSKPFTWTFAQNETVINTPTVLFANLSGDFKVLTLTETQLRISKTHTFSGVPIPVTIIATFKH